MSRNNRDYLLNRAAKERQLAAQASDDVVAGIHERLAHEYEVRANISETEAKTANDAGPAIGSDRAT
jgi:hypothetical protein